LSVAEPQVPGPLRSRRQLHQRLQEQGLPRWHVLGLPTPLLLHHALPRMSYRPESSSKLPRTVRARRRRAEIDGWPSRAFVPPFPNLSCLNQTA
ncbi:hypothetical protein BAE44_0006680, partial [Dichanthelium oligosanthes]